MNTTKVYRGIIKDTFIRNLSLSSINKMKLKQDGIDISRYGIETLFYKKDNNLYQDLKTGKIYEEGKIDELVPLNRIIEIKKTMSKKSILEKYEENLYQLLLLSDLYIGDIGMISNAEQKIKTTTSGLEVDIHLQLKILKKQRLLLKDKEKYTDLEDYIHYYDTNFITGDMMVVNTEPFYRYLNEHINNSEIEKVKALEQYHKRF